MITAETMTRELIARATAAAGYRPVSDQFWADLSHGATLPLVAATSFDGGSMIAYAHATAIESDWTVEAVIDPAHHERLDDLAAQLLASIEHDVRARGGHSLTWLVQGPTPSHVAAANGSGYKAVRHIHQMRRPLPTGVDVDIATRPFDVARDLDHWVTVNGRAFAWNPEQSAWTADNVLARMDEPWFDPAGFLIHDRDGRMAGFCWTKIHRDLAPVAGEIYIIAVDPDFHGLGLGRALTLAGLASISDHDVTIGMLFVEDQNRAAMKLYDSLGFSVHRTDTMFRKELV